MSAASICIALSLTTAPPEWRALGTGIEYASVTLDEKPSFGDGRLHVVRVTAGKAKLEVLTLRESGGRERTAAAWRRENGFVAVINAGMFETDRKTHTGYLRVGAALNNPKWVKTYNSILLIGPEDASRPAFTLEDIAPGARAKDFTEYRVVSQNLRLIRGPGRNVWAENGKRWSEAAVAIDQAGRILLLFSRSPFSMRELNAKLLALPLGIVRAMHVEGGPEASLSIAGGGLELDLAGSYETGFLENDDNQEQWPLPNVLGVRPT